MIKSIKQFGSGAVLIQWDQIISGDILSEISALSEYFQQKSNVGIIDVVPAYASITIFFKPEMLKYDALVDLINDFEFFTKSQQIQSVKEIKVRYSSETDRDMKLLMNLTGLGRDRIINIHSSNEYSLCFIGFLPGFLYLSGLDPSLHIPRKTVPDFNIKAGSVAIGGQQTGIYPQDSPGGWYVIGHTDFSVIDLYHKPYCTLKPGDCIKFKKVV